MFRIKICGVTRTGDAELAVQAGADAIGLNFYARSPRSVTADQARPIADLIGDRALKVGVFVNSTAEEIVQTAERVGLDAVQLHGDEPPELIARLPRELPVIRADRMGQAGLAPVADFAERCRKSGRSLSALLIDAAAPEGQYGGTGRTVDWSHVARDRPLLGSTPVILAGGLRPENVAEAIAAARPDGVDAASGVESAPGRKDPAAVAAFVAGAREALERWESGGREA